MWSQGVALSAVATRRGQARAGRVRESGVRVGEEAASKTGADRAVVARGFPVVRAGFWRGDAAVAGGGVAAGAAGFTEMGRKKGGSEV